ncbi:MAG: DUF3667 domain-containing protein [Arenimonas sp.]
MQAPVDDSANAAAPAAPAPPARRCENCGSPLYGEHCFACGQPTKGLVRHFSSILGDFFDTVFNIDSRVIRTIGPLLARPGVLSLEYFAGRRVRYVTPMRLFLFLSLVAFFSVQGSIDFNDGGGDGDHGGIHIGSPNQDSFARANTPAEVQRVGTQALAELDKARKQVENVPGSSAGLEMARQKIKQKMQERLARLAELEAARKAGKPVPAQQSSRDEGNDLNFPINGKDWDPETNPVSFAWLPGSLNHWLNKRAAHARSVLKNSDSGKPVIDALFNVLPQTLLVMMPIFALMLKLAYFFKRRLYMEHLIVALHSHSFIALAVALIMGLSWLIGVVPDGSFVAGLLNWLRGLTIAWIPLYLLLMQKRVYAQGWPMTLAKYSVLGVCYSVLLGFALLAAMLVGLLTL